MKHGAQDETFNTNVYLLNLSANLAFINVITLLLVCHVLFILNDNQ